MKSDDQKFKADAGKTNPALLEMGFPRALRLVQACLDYGAKKYEAHSWRDVPNAVERYTVACRRHRQARDLDADAKNGFHAILESCDAESGLPHIAHEVFNLLALIELEFKASEDTAKANELLMRIVGQMKEPPTSHKEYKRD